uniref:Cadherin domain-containing protein n=1 Tax=Plectus sambesii TaxID=2011161 RepID=A0A914VBZ1_9BILA
MRDDEVIVANELDAETNARYNLTIEIKTITSGIAINSTLGITVEDANDIAPMFEREKYNFRLDNPQQTGAVVGSVKATDGDLTAPNNVIGSYQMERSAEGFFYVDAKSGAITAGEKLRTELYDEYSFSVTARDTGDPSLQAVTVVTVHMDGKTETDIPPRFDQSNYRFTIYENNPRPVRIGSVNAYHSGGKIEYSLAEPSPFFTINGQTGDLDAHVVFDYEVRQNYTTLVKACVVGNSTSDSAPKQLCSDASVVLDILDVNDNAPTFEQASYTLNVPVDIGIGAEILRVHAIDLDSLNNGDLSYVLKTQTGIFAVDYETGVVTVVGAMTAPNIFNLTIEAFDHGTPTLRGTTVVSIVANGSNPSAPEFEKFRYDVTQPSTVDVGTLLVTLKATDPDPGLEGLVIYRFANDSVTQQQAPSFSLNQESGELKTIKLLDYHTKASYQLVIEAVDSSPFYPRKAQTVVRIQLVDSGNNSPKFLPLPDTVFVSTLKPPGSMIVRALAADGEGTPISYSLEGGDGFFEMDNERLVVLKELQSGKFPLTISATDGRQTTSHAMTVVVMADRDKYPVFPQLSYRIQVPINANFPYLVQPFQAKVQTGSLRYEIILPQPPIQGLSIDPAMGDLFVNADFIANRSVGGRPVFAIIRATNNDYEAFYSDVTVEIAITNNQSGLNFPSQLFRLTVDENTPANTKLNLSIIVARASLYPNVRYRLEPNDTFSVDATTGQLVVIKETDLEKMTKQSNGIFDLTIYATTSNETTKSNVQIKINDVNEFTPKFDKAVYAVKISENIRAGEFIVQVRAFDQDYSEGDKLIYRIKDGSAKDYITIDETGNIYKSNGSALDREQADRLNITIEAVDRNGNTDEARIDFEIVDYNDNAPQFVGEPFTWNVTEGPDGIGQTFRLRASDLDQGQNGAITFRITQGNELKLFLLRNISNSEAELSVITELDREDKDRRILTIEARDNGDPSLVSLTTVEVLVQDVNDNPPHFMKSLYDQKVPADFPIGFSLFTVLADDPDSDSKINYTIVDETPVSGIFTIDATQGFVRFGRRPPLVNQTYTLTIEASDGLFTDRANISIQVYTTNDSRPTGQNLPPVFEQPQYEFSVVEGEWNTRVGQVEVTDPDSDAFLDMWIEPPDYRELFWVANASGYIYTKTALEYSVGKESYSFIIVAQDFGIPPLTAFTNVKVIIIDVNDHAPKFDRSDYSALIPAEARPPYPLSLMIKATDMDAGLNAKIKYSLSGEDADCFEIDSASAQIQLTCTPDYTSKTKYLMDVIATDRDGDGNSTIVQLSVLVSPPVVTSEPVTVDPNVTTSTTTTQITPTGQSCQPQFSPSTDTLTLVESRPVDDPVFIAIARCGECSTACRPTYSLIKPTSEAAGYFTLSTDGLLKLAKQLSVDDMTANGVLDASSSLTLTINATLASGESAQLTLTIRVVKQDIKPGEAVRFERLSYTFSIEEEQAEGATVGTVVAIPPNGQTTITYTIESEQFRMNQDKPGVIETTQQLDADGPNNRREYNLIVEATSGSSTATTLVIVKLIDINDNAPKFSESLYTSLMPEGTYGHTVVSFKPNNLAAFDADQGHNALLTYHIVNDDPTLPFIIDKTTGELSLVGTVDRENIPYYIFTVTATDDGTPQLNGSTTVNVTILDVNDNYPEFINATAVVAVSEDWQTGREIARFYAEDKDGDQLGHVLYGLSNFTDSFAIDAEDGILTSIKPFLITQQDIYLVPIVARDLGRPALRRTHILRVEVFPKDQYDPLFKESVYAASVANGSQPGAFIIQVTAGVGPFEYGIVDDYSGLFAIDAKTGVIILGRLPIDQEKNRYHELNVTARNVTNSAIASTMVNVFFESDTTTTPAPDTCTFSNKQYNAEIYENINATTLLIDLNATCESSGSFYSISQGTDEFEINNRTGELYAVKPLDRERRSLHFITINVTKTARLRLRRQVNPIIEREKAKLLPMQTLVVVRVLDVNDNTPVFVNVGPDGITYSYTVDWQAAIGTIIGTIKAFDRDESSKVTYSISALTEGDGSKFSIDPVSGQLSLAVSLANINQDVFKFDVAATDNDTTKPLLAPVVVYRLSLGVNLVLITSNKPAHTINNDLFERKLTELTGWTVKILAKQAYVADNGDVDPNKSHLFVYAVDRKTGAPIPREELKNRLEQLLDDLKGPDLGVEGIALPVIQDSAAISVWELVLLVICALIIFTAFLGICFLLRWWNRSSKDRKKKLESEYMVDSTSSGPRPYNVETLDRKTAQNTLVSKRQAAYAPSAVPTIRMKVNGIPPITAAPYTDTSDISNENSSRGSNTSVLSRPHPSCDEYGVIGPRSRNFAGGDMEAIRTLARRPLPPNEMGSWTNRSPSLHRLALSYRDRSDDR